MSAINSLNYELAMQTRRKWWTKQTLIQQSTNIEILKYQMSGSGHQSIHDFDVKEFFVIINQIWKTGLDQNDVWKKEKKIEKGHKGVMWIIMLG